MTDFYCTTCKKPVDEPICSTCGNPTDPAGDRSTVERPQTGTAPPLPSRPDVAAQAPPSNWQTQAAPPPQPPRQTAPPPPPAAPTIQMDLGAGQRKLEADVAAGYEVFLIVGIAEAGKTELLGSVRQIDTSNVIRKEGKVLRTAMYSIDTFPIERHGRKMIFTDTSGENFRYLYPQMRPTGEIAERDIAFLRLIARNLKGLILLVDLERLWGPAGPQSDPADRQQVEILAWVLALLRWLRHDGTHVEGGPLSLKEQVQRSVQRMKRKLTIPVQVLFSKADRLIDLPVPRVEDAAWLRRAAGPSKRLLYPVGEDPLLFAWHCLPDLWEAVDKHAKSFRFDFAHALTTDRDSGAIDDRHPCGVTLALDWLLDSRWRWPMVSTRRWVALQRLVDEKLLKRRRWQRLPDPVEVR